MAQDSLFLCGGRRRIRDANAGSDFKAFLQDDATWPVLGDHEKTRFGCLDGICADGHRFRRQRSVAAQERSDTGRDGEPTAWGRRYCVQHSVPGAVNAAGEFCNGSGIIGFANGIVLTSGSANSVLGPNNSSGAGTDNGLPGDPSLDALIPGYQTFDACVIEFDFIPQGNQVQFNYVFGSEEYNDFVNSPFNDVFGFFVNGVNYALIPGTATPVAINNVNNGYSSGVSTGPCHNCAYYIDNVDGHLNTQLDGLTVVLPMIAPVTPGSAESHENRDCRCGRPCFGLCGVHSIWELEVKRPACVTRTARFWFTHAETNDPACVTLRAALQSGMYAGCGQFDLGSLSLPTTYRNSDNILDVNDALVEALGFYYKSTGVTGEPGSTQSSRSGLPRCAGRANNWRSNSSRQWATLRCWEQILPTAVTSTAARSQTSRQT